MHKKGSFLHKVIKVRGGAKVYLFWHILGKKEIKEEKQKVVAS